MFKDAETPPPLKYNYRGKTVTNNGEKTSKIKYTAIESLLKGTNLYDNPSFLAEIKPFFDPKYPRREYTVDTYTEILDRICDWLYPFVSREEGREQVGRLIFEGFHKTIIGRVALAAMHLRGPGKLLMLSPRFFEDAAGTGERIVTELDKNKYIFASRGVAGTWEDGCGVIKAGLEAVGAKNLRCKVTILAPDSWDFLLEWD